MSFSPHPASRVEQDDEQITPEDFAGPKTRPSSLAWQGSPESGKLQEQIDEKSVRTFRETTSAIEEPQFDIATVSEAFAQSVHQLHERNLKDNLFRLANICQEAELQGDAEQLAELTQMQ